MATNVSFEDGKMTIVSDQHLAKTEGKVVVGSDSVPYSFGVSKSPVEIHDTTGHAWTLESDEYDQETGQSTTVYSY
jgi:hypothetical protein